MRIVAIITERSVITKILAHLAKAGAATATDVSHPGHCTAFVAPAALPARKASATRIGMFHSRNTIRNPTLTDFSVALSRRDLVTLNCGNHHWQSWSDRNSRRSTQHLIPLCLNRRPNRSDFQEAVSPAFEHLISPQNGGASRLDDCSGRSGEAEAMRSFGVLFDVDELESGYGYGHAAYRILFAVENKDFASRHNRVD